MRYLGGMGFGRMGGVVVGERVAWEEGGAPTRGQSGGCTSEGILSMMMARLCLFIIISINNTRTNTFEKQSTRNTLMERMDRAN